MGIIWESLGISRRGLTLVAVVGAWLAGILLDSLFPLPSLFMLIGAGTALLFVVLLRHDHQGRLIMLLLFCALLGAWRYSDVQPGNASGAISTFIGPEAIAVKGAVADEPKLEGRTRVLVVSVTGISKDGGASWAEAHGQMEIQNLGTTIEDPYSANYGDNIELRGKIQPPRPNSSPDIVASMAFPGITVESAGGNPVIAWLYHLRVVLANSIERTLPQPEAALLIAIVLGLL